MPDTEHAAQAAAQGRPEPMWPVMWSPAQDEARDESSFDQDEVVLVLFERSPEWWSSERVEKLIPLGLSFRAPDGGTVL